MDKLWSEAIQQTTVMMSSPTKWSSFMPHSLSACMLGQLLRLYPMSTEHFHIENTQIFSKRKTDTKHI